MQMELFDDMEMEEVTIPKDVVSPIESKRRIGSKQFELERERFIGYVKAIQDYHKCSWIVARELFFKHRDNQQPIFMEKVVE